MGGPPRGYEGTAGHFLAATGRFYSSSEYIHSSTTFFLKHSLCARLCSAELELGVRQTSILSSLEADRQFTSQIHCVSFSGEGISVVKSNRKVSGECYGSGVAVSNERVRVASLEKVAFEDLQSLEEGHRSLRVER